MPKYYRYTMFTKVNGQLVVKPDNGPHQPNPKNFSNKSYAMNHAKVDLRLGYTLMIEPIQMAKDETVKFF